MKACAALIGGQFDARCDMRLSHRDALGVLSILQRGNGFCNHAQTGNGHVMNALMLLRSHLGTAFALGAVLLTALTLTALRLSFPAEVPGLELLLFGWIGVALGRLTVRARSSESSGAKGSPGTAEKSRSYPDGQSPGCSRRI